MLREVSFGGQKCPLVGESVLWWAKVSFGEKSVLWKEKCPLVGKSVLW